MQRTTENIWSAEAPIYFILETGSLPLSLHLQIPEDSYVVLDKGPF